MLDLYQNISKYNSFNKFLDNEIANDYWEYKLPSSVKKPTESSAPEVAWQFIQNKYVKKLYAPKNTLDPVTEYKQNKISGGKNKNKKEEEEDDVDIKKEVPAKQKPPVVVSPKINIDDLADIGHIEPNVQFDFEPKVDEKVVVEKKVPTVNPVQFYTNPEPNKFSVFDQLSFGNTRIQPNFQQYSNPKDPFDFSNMRSASAFLSTPGTVFQPIQVQTKVQEQRQIRNPGRKEQKRVEAAFSNLLPSEFN